MRVMPLIAAAAMTSAVAGCGSDGSSASNDPYESTNRSFYASHQVLYKNVIRPVAATYNDTVPETARDGIHNFLVNIDLPVTFGNDLLQGRVVQSGETLARFTVNTTIGIGGFIDVAEKIGIPEHETGFADTLADYGVGEGSYLYLPVIGPMVPRELVGKVADSAFDPLTYVTYGASFFVDAGRTGATYVDKRARGVATVDAIQTLSPDPYATTRILYEKHLAAEADHSTADPDFDDNPDAVRLAIEETPGATLASADQPQDAGAYCESVAQSRADDAAANGYESDDQQAIHDGAYKDCLSWKAGHAGTGDGATQVIALK